jgi:hypothetical protein
MNKVAVFDWINAPQEKVVGCCENSNTLSGSIKCGRITAEYSLPSLVTY